MYLNIQFFLLNPSAIKVLLGQKYLDTINANFNAIDFPL